MTVFQIWNHTFQCNCTNLRARVLPGLGGIQMINSWENSFEAGPMRDRAKVWLLKLDCLTFPGPVLRRGFFTNNDPPRCLLIPHFFSPVPLCCCSSLLLYRAKSINEQTPPPPKKWRNWKEQCNLFSRRNFPPAPHYDREIRRKGETRGMQAEEEKVSHCLAEQWNWRGK